MTWAPHTHSACQPGIEPLEAGDRCTGACCRCFTLPFTHEEIVEAWRSGEIPGQYASAADIELILSMVRPLPDQGRDQYTCILFDVDGCTAYERRPSMCSGYPYGRRCEHGKLCTSRAARRGEARRSTRPAPEPVALARRGGSSG